MGLTKLIKKIKSDKSELEQLRIYKKYADDTIERLKDIERINMVIKEKNLAKCESAVCVSCIHCETVTDRDGNRQIIGCRKLIACSDYEPSKEPIKPLMYGGGCGITYPNYSNQLSQNCLRI